jgi:ubiquinone/menaquinone biosynthesis C-methylase UbiE
LDEQSAGLIAMLGGEPFKAPLPGPPKKILDVGCGTGVMTSMLGSMFPDARVYGVDLVEVPDSNFDNVTFIRGDIRELMSADTKCPDIFTAGSFDYIYSRAIVFGLVDWPSYLRQVYRILAPGGIYEIQEHSQKYFDGKDQVMGFEVTKEINKYLSDTGHDPLAGHHAPENLQNAGFHILHEQYFRWPLSSNPDWPDSVKLGTFMWNSMPDFMPKVVTGLLEPRLGEQRAKEVIDSWFKDRENGRMGPGVHSKFTVAVGQKSKV